MTTSVGRDRPFAAGLGRRGRPMWRSRHDGSGVSPIVAAVEGSGAGLAAARTAARLARWLGSPLILVYVRRRPWGGLGAPFHQRRLDAEMAAARRALDAALAAAREEGAVAEGEILEGNPARRVIEFARHRDARLLVLGARRWRFGRSVSRRVISASERPVVVAGAASVAPRAAG
jgi:nucleotide-binding universal stress UspA family protein